MLKAKDYPAGSPIYTFIHDKGENFHIDSVRLRLWCLKNNPEIFLVPVDPSIGKEYIRDKVVSQRRLLQLFKRYNSSKEDIEPIIFGRFPYPPPDAMLIDGHHRFTLASMFKAEFISAFVLEIPQWEAFRIEGLPDLTQKVLRNRPVAERNY